MTNEDKAQAAASGYEKCDRLLNNPDVLWFIEEALTQPRAQKEQELKDLGTARDVREIAAHVREALERAERFLARRRDIYFRDLPRPAKQT